MTSTTSRYLRSLQRAQASGAGPRLARAAAAGAILFLPVACGNGDEDAFQTATDESTEASVTATSETGTSETGTSETGTSEAGTSETTAATADSSESTTSSASASAIPAGSELLVSFSYQPSDSGQTKRPYVAVWVEDLDGNLVDTISLWFEQGGKGTKWLSDLPQWHAVSGGEDTTMSGATKVAGDYIVAWDGTDLDGNDVPAGDYVLNVESAREHGPTSFTSTPISLAGEAISVSLEDDGELSAIAASIEA